MAAIAKTPVPSVLNVLATPWKQAGQAPAAAQSPSSYPAPVHHEMTPQSVKLPAFLNLAPQGALKPGIMTQPALHGLSSILNKNSLLSPFSPLGPARAFGFQAARSYSTVFTSSTVKTPRSQTPQTTNASSKTLKNSNQRSLFGGPSHSILAQMEKTANGNLNSANAQNAFYQALLRANMPAIVLERHRTAQFASNQTTQNIISQALQRTAGEGAAAQQSSFSPEQLQAAAQAVIGHRGGHGNAKTQSGLGTKEQPMCVVVEDSFGTVFYRWAKLAIGVGLFLWACVLIVSIVVESTGLVKNMREPTNKEVQAEQQKARFKDVHGCDEAKDELQELVEFLMNPEKFSALGGKLPKGVLLVGPPGTGKTLLARAVAGEAGVPFFYMSGSEFDEVYVGVGAKRVRDLFAQARGKAPAIIFIDELDAIGGKRNERDAAYVKQTLNQLLTELDGFSQSENVIILAATNYPQLLDKALTRPGRFDRRVVVGLPDVRGRMDILRHHAKGVRVSNDVDFELIARGTPGFSGAELESLVNEAAVHATREHKTNVGTMDFDWAKDKIMMGAEAKSRIIQQKDKILTAYHEAGHALVAYHSPSATPLHKITIVPRGMALGVTHFLPEMDIVSRNYKEYLADIAVAMGGKVAEEMIFGPDNVTSGISADIQSATETAFTLVTRFGYSKKLGNVDLSSNYDRLSSETKQDIEAEVRRLVEEALMRATEILSERRPELELLAQALMEYETLTREEMVKVTRKEKLEGRLSSSPNAPIKLPDALETAGLTRPPAQGPITTAKE
ncbi:ATPase AAA-type core [Penicillium capsulatum]|uniref:ATPase AAA-type core n=1 Tax=Penicillium capsulatum TaxID=69766 RepID=A0A9W9IUD5_9EURO|nr:ATPase AAA-type core [Penicillium capsulatum]